MDIILNFEILTKLIIEIKLMACSIATPQNVWQVRVS